ncbi:flagellar protein FlgN [Acetobacter sp.]|uniref:flagellar protein FlgN n=1 Tax=Acetobacter sp. TaxID=440 RepID=UPI0039E8920B
MENALTVIEETTALLEEENSNIASGNIAIINAYLNRKESLLNRVASLSVDCEKENSTDRCCSEDLLAAAQKFETTLEENRALLKRAMIAQSHIVQLLTNAITRSQDQPHYGKNGRFNSLTGTAGQAYKRHA